MLRAFGGGAMLGVAFADLLPEALTVSLGRYSASTLSLMALGGFLIYATLTRILTGEGAPGMRRLAPASLVAHSVMDGFGIGLAFSVSKTAGTLLASAVLTHDLVDGANTVILSVSGGTRQSRPWAWLLADALAPLVGIGLSCLVSLSPAVLAPILALLSGFFLYLAGQLLIAALTGGSIANLFAMLIGSMIIVAITLVRPI